MNRRRFLASSLTGAAVLPMLQACSPRDQSPNDEDVMRDATDSAVKMLPNRSDVLRDVVRHATMAASSHNTQPWTFTLGERAITVLPDLSRRLPIVDPDDHHLFVSLGCATENLVHSALAHGLHADCAVHSDRIDVALEDTAHVRSPLFDAIPHRQCSRSVYDGQAVSIPELRLLEAAGRADGVNVIVLTDKARMETVLEYVARGNTAQIGDPAFVRELKDWIRFNKADALRTGDGLFSGSTGSPAIPRWLGRLLLGALLTPKSENDKGARQLRSSAGVAIFVSDESRPSDWIQVGRCYERFALQATSLGIRSAFLNQPVEVVALRSQFAAWLSIGERRPDLVVRFGRGPEMPRSRRRPVEQVLI